MMPSPSRVNLRAVFAGSLVVVLLGSVPRGLAQQAFTPGNLVVLQVGDGTSTLGPTAAPVSVVEFTTAGVQVGSPLALPSTTVPGTFNLGNFSLGGAVKTEGGLRLSADGHYLTAIGYDAAVGTAGGSGVGGVGSNTTISNSASTVINRVIARIDASKSAAGIDTTTRLSDAFNQDSVRSVISSDGSQFWAGGKASDSSGGIRYVGSLGATTSTSVVSTEVRQVTIAADRLFAATTTAINGVGNNVPPPTAASSLSSLGVSPSNPNSYVFLDRDPNVGATGLNGLDTLYVANANVGSALLKYEWDPSTSTWVARGTVSNSGTVGGTNSGLFGLAAQIRANGVNLYATDMAASSALLSITDSSGFGGDITGSLSVLVQANSGTAFRGLDFAPTPVPEPVSALFFGMVGLAVTSLFRRSSGKG